MVLDVATITFVCLFMCNARGNYLGVSVQVMYLSGFIFHGIFVILFAVAVLFSTMGLCCMCVFVCM